mmetsp:Transcript_33417/g.60375  ORF Transcript_33417/g.60375 Transcript_33417/m.60375 type:complete len:342 (-) Transcript_33417:607-1632(-)|eukprot:CAMPEP_0175059172 /NCGR_PEP_ID=MMETSP0052_2-20121109/12279_1 /TAXON_ID=51329 ORGANISM="Polytomella parva, Strain SAG 63-3" /NCGR_SAMPLE_ID=MMETSP0052_2 /ASSEMBLY_ACC=CAM_ASM_000194 /LENGTH=341 /DNA_ID=CAMNT_0016324681 /DNA_START=694 /DNA_END=1719 /DNA_ORIENTATION=-
MATVLYTQKRWSAYVPWIALFCFLLVFVGMIVWAVGTNRALGSTNKALHLLEVELDGTFNTIKDATTGAVVVCVLMSVLMVLLALSRKSLEKKIDLYGKAVCGTWMYLAVEAVVSALWWCILFWLVFVIFGGCLLYGATYTVEGAIALTMSQIQAANNTGNYNYTKSMETYKTAGYCPGTCFNVGYFSYYTSVENLCVCNATSLAGVYKHVDTATHALNLYIVGSFLMWVGASFLLINAVGAFASTRRERELLIRAQKNAQEVVNAQLALGVAGSVPRLPDNAMYYNTYKDTQPLLMQQQQQQQQQYLQMMPQMLPPQQGMMPQAVAAQMPPASMTGARAV